MTFDSRTVRTLLTATVFAVGSGAYLTMVKPESAPLWTDAPEPLGEAVRTVATMEAAVLADAPVGIVLRYGAFYGPGTWYTGDGDIATRMEIGVMQSSGDLQQSTDQLLQSFARTNPDLRRRGGYSRANVGGRQGLTTTLTNVSEVTGAPETVNLSTVQLQDGSLLYMIGVAPQNEANTYNSAFNRVRQTLRLAD